MKKIYFDKPKKMDGMLTHFQGLAVDSEKVSKVTYISQNGKCGIVTVDGVAIWPAEETPSIIEALIEEIKAEAQEVFKEIKDWERFR